MRQLDSAFDVGDVLLSTAEKGEIRVNIGDVDTKAGYAINVPVWGPDGYLTRPNDPEDGACRAVYFVDGHNRRVLATCDYRFAKQAGTLDPGDRMVVTDGPSRFFLRKKDQRIGFYTESIDDATVGGKGMLLDLSGKEAAITIKVWGCLIHLDGKAGRIMLTASNGSQASTLVLDAAKGASVISGSMNIDCGFVTVGLNSGGVRPGIPGVDTALYGAMGQTGVASASVFIAKG